MQKQYVSDLIGDDYSNWSNERIIINAGTGAGKSYFCTHILGDIVDLMGYKMLYLCNRSKLKEKIINDIKELGYTDSIDVMTYQALEQRIINKVTIPYYDYIVADECHYFFQDSGMNEFTDLSLEYLKNCTNSVVIYMSATARGFIKRIVKEFNISENNIYSSPETYDYVEKIYFYHKEKLINIIENILTMENDTKIIVFLRSSSRMFEMYEHFKRIQYADEVSYYYSKSTDSNILRAIPRNGCIHDNTFDGRVLFTTTALDNGIDFKDEKIKHVIVEMMTLDELQQCLGRKRIVNEHDTCNFYIRDYYAIDNVIREHEEVAKVVRLYREDMEQFLVKYFEQDRNNPIVQKFFYSKRVNRTGGELELVLNEPKYMNYLEEGFYLRFIKNQGFRKVVMYYLGEQLWEKAETWSPVKGDALIEYLKSIEGIRFYFDSADGKELCVKFVEDGMLNPKDAKLPYKKFNSYLDTYYKDRYFGRFVSRSDRRRRLDDGTINANRDKKYIILEQNNE